MGLRILFLTCLLAARLFAAETAEPQSKVDELWRSRAVAAQSRIDAYQLRMRDSGGSLSTDDHCALILETAYVNYQEARHTGKYEGFENGNVYELVFTNPLQRDPLMPPSKAPKMEDTDATMLAVIYQPGSTLSNSLLVPRLSKGWFNGILQTKNSILDIASSECVFLFSLSEPLGAKSMPR